MHGYYPKTGTKEYDLFGRGLILATRYESLRKKLFSNSDTHIVILQSDVYADLSMEEKKVFETYDFPKDFVVRDDERASSLYYQLVSYRAQTTRDAA
ncbi:MAG: hypothetical protein HRU19_22120 [Pseudobacteriovorax sp.]|nr:hypothetical protein [Pseudobacteriovorax sp.]